MVVETEKGIVQWWIFVEVSEWVRKNESELRR